MLKSPRDVTRTISGTWWTPDDQTPIEGELFLEHGERNTLLDCCLKIAADWPPEPRSSALVTRKWGERIPVIFGKDVNGLKVSALKLMGRWGDWQPAGVLLGAHLSMQSRAVSSISAEITNFQPWLNNVSKSTLSDTGDCLVLEVAKVTQVLSEQTAVGIVELIHTAKMSQSDVFEVTIRSHITLKINFEASQSLDDAARHFLGMCNLLSLLAGVEVEQDGPLKIYGLNGETAALHISSIGAPKKHETDYPRVSFAGQVSALPVIVKNWFALSGQTRSVISMLSRYYLDRNFDTELTFLRACKIAESLARALDNEGRIAVPAVPTKKPGKAPRRDFEPCLKTLFRAIMADAYLTKIAARHDSQLASFGTEVSAEALNAFMANLVWTRDELTHVVLDNGKGHGRALVLTELIAAANTVAFAATCVAIQQLLPEPGLAWASLSREFGWRQLETVNCLFD